MVHKLGLLVRDRAIFAYFQHGTSLALKVFVITHFHVVNTNLIQHRGI